MRRRNGSALSAPVNEAGESAADISRRLEMLEKAEKRKVVRDIFEEEELMPLERVDFGAKPVDAHVVRRLAAMGCQDEEIAEAFDISAHQLRDGFSEYLRIGRAQGRTALRRKQWQKAMQGNVTMLIHLGKNLLGQSDSLEVKGKIEHEHEHSMLGAKEQLLEKIREAATRIRNLDPADEIPMPRLVSPESDGI